MWKLLEQAILCLLLKMASSQESSSLIEGCGKGKGCLSDGGNSVRVSFRNALEPDWLDIELMAEGQGEIYAALGFSTDQFMGQDYVVYCVSVNDNVEAYVSVNPGGDSPNERLTGVQKQKYLELVSGEKVDGRLYCKLKLLRETPGGTAAPQIKLLNESYYLFLASGVANGPGKIHKHRSTPNPTKQKINIAEAKYEDVQLDDAPFSSQVKLALIKSHGILMLIGWWLVITNTIVLARYAKYSMPNVKIAGKPLWLGVHMYGNWFGILITVVGFICIFVAKEGEWGGPKAGEFSNPSPEQHHSLFGLIASIFGFLEGVTTIYLCFPGNKRRPIFNFIHRTFGITGWILATASLWHASELYFFSDHRSATQKLMIFYLVSLGIIVMALEEILRVIEARLRGPGPTDDVPMQRSSSYQVAPSPATPTQMLGIIGMVPVNMTLVRVLISLAVVVPISVFIGIWSPH